NAWRTFTSVTWPVILPTALATLLVKVVIGFKVFDLVVVVTEGGPGVSTILTPFEIYRTALRGDFNVGIAAAETLVFGLLVAAGAALVTVLAGVPAAYFTARAGRRGERLGTLLLAGYCAPPIVAMLPLYYLLKSIGLANTLLGLILVNGLANVPVAVWLLDG